MIFNGNVSNNFSITPDSSTVVYLADQETNEVYELYSVPIGGGDVTKINGILVTGGDVGDPAFPSRAPFSISPDSSRVVYVADQDSDTVMELYSVFLVSDPDDDGIQSRCDVCPVDSDPGQEDFDADTLGDVCDPDDDNDTFGDPSDCLDTDPMVWALPGEARDLLFASDARTLSWTVPSDLGGAFVVYDTLRSGHPSDFAGFGTCLETDGADASAVDTAIPGLGMLFSYLVRAENACGAGSLGTDSSGTPRQGLSCP